MPPITKTRFWRAGEQQKKKHYQLHSPNTAKKALRTSIYLILQKFLKATQNRIHLEKMLNPIISRIILRKM
jgi:hypothetical protein